MGNKYHEVYKPSRNIEYWCVVDELNCDIHYFKSSEHAQKFANDFHYRIIYKECFD